MMHNIDWKKAQTAIATKLYQDTCYQNDKDVLTVYDKDTVSFVTTAGDNKICTCIAASHGQRCICLQVAELVLDNSAEQSHDFIEALPFTSQTILSRLNLESNSNCSLKVKVKEIHEWFTIDSFETFDQKDQLKKQILNLHSLIFTKKFKKATHKKKIYVNCSYR